MKTLKFIGKAIKVGFNCMSNFLMWIVIGIPCAILISLGIAIALMQGKTIDDIKMLFLKELNRTGTINLQDPVNKT